MPTRAKPTLKASKAAVTLTPDAVRRLQQLVSGPTPQLIRIGVRNKGCAGMSYHLEYVEKPGRFDEVVEQDGVKVLIDSKALFSIIGSEMHWQEDRMSSKFVFNNPNVVDACGCGESFNIAT
ncbi:Iron-sulfur assembly protein 1 [Ceratobasidium sp. 428]|nr:Iron-sulfur assembly protein 1 [Ceratobasidium sp. 428]